MGWGQNWAATRENCGQAHTEKLKITQSAPEAVIFLPFFTARSLRQITSSPVMTSNPSLSSIPFNSLRNFSPSFVRDMALSNNPHYEGKDFKEFYNLVCKFSHPSFVSMNQNDFLNLDAKTDIEKSTLFILMESSTIFIDILKEFIGDSYKEIFEKTYSELSDKLSKE